jgi:hypothetical protein
MSHKENLSANDRRPSFVAWPITEVKDTFVMCDTVEQKIDEATIGNQYSVTVVMQYWEGS